MHFALTSSRSTLAEVPGCAAPTNEWKVSSKSVPIPYGHSGAAAFTLIPVSNNVRIVLIPSVPRLERFQAVWKPHLQNLSNTLDRIADVVAPGCSTLFFQNSSSEDWEARMLVTFKTPGSPVLTDGNYHTYSSNLTSISLCLQHLEDSLPLRREITSCLTHHHPTSTSQIYEVIDNIEQLFKVLLTMRGEMQQRFWAMLDSDALASAAILRRIMADVSRFFRIRFSSLIFGRPQRGSILGDW